MLLKQLFIFLQHHISNIAMKRISDIIPPSLLHRIRMWIQIFLFLVSFIVVGVIVVDYGFVLDNHDMSLILKVYRYAWWIYLFAYLSQLTFQWNSITRKTVFMTVLFGILLFLSALPKFITPTSGWMTDAWKSIWEHYWALMPCWKYPRGW